jgi:hypothetical protein
MTMIIGSLGHGWMTKPMSRNAIAAKLGGSQFGVFRNAPQSSANGWGYGQRGSAPGHSCGANTAVYAQGPSTWKKWYGAGEMASLTPGSDIEVNYKLTADHYGQIWMMVACADRIDETLNWVYLKRSESDRSRNFMPSKPNIFAWKGGIGAGGVIRARYSVPASLSCPNGFGVGRLVWKTANSCTDSNNVGLKTETFDFEEYSSVTGNKIGVCSKPPETFISCFDFTTKTGGPAVSGTDGPKPNWCGPTGTPNPTPTNPPNSPNPTNPPKPSSSPSSGTCVDSTLSGAWGSHTCDDIEAMYGSTYCAHAAIGNACCICKRRSRSARMADCTRMGFITSSSQKSSFFVMGCLLATLQSTQL